MKRLLAVLFLLVALPAFAAWKFNPHTGKLDYYEVAGAPADNSIGTSKIIDNTVTPIKLKASGTPDNTMVPFWDSSGLFRWAAPSGHAAATVADSATIDFSITGQEISGGVITTGLDCAVAGGASGIMTGADKSKLDGIAAGAEVNVNADWNSGSGDSQILNKPTLGGAASLNVGTAAGTVAAGDDGRFVTNGNSHDHAGGDGAQIAYSGLSGLPTLAQSEAGAANNFLTAYNSGTGAFSKAQPTWANIDKGTSSIADITTRSHTALSDIGTNTHAQVDTFIASKAAASGLASLDAGSLVVQNPANATATPTASKIVIADAGGKVDGWITAASETAAGKVELATDAETVTGTDTARAVTPANARAAYTPTNIAATPGSDHASTGPKTNALNAGGTITIMDLVILNSSSQWVQTDANAAATYAGMLAISLESKTTGQAMSVALLGSFVRDDTWNWTPGATLYLFETAGAITATQPTTTDAAIRIIGYAVTADVIWFMPDGAWITHT